MLCAMLFGNADGGSREAELGLEFVACIDVE